MLSLQDEVGAMVTELASLRLQTESDAKTISLLKKQNEVQAIELTTVKHEHEKQLQSLRQERDVALRKATEVRGIIENVGSMALQGIRKMRGDETPYEPMDGKVDHPRLPVMSIEMLGDDMEHDMQKMNNKRLTVQN